MYCSFIVMPIKQRGKHSSNKTPNNAQPPGLMRVTTVGGDCEAQRKHWYGADIFVSPQSYSRPSPAVKQNENGHRSVRFPVPRHARACQAEAKEIDFRAMSQRSLASFLLVLGLWVGLLLACASQNRSGPPASSRPKLTSEHRSAILAALKAKRYPGPTEIEITDGEYLVATFELSRPPAGRSWQSFGEDAVITIRNAMLPFKSVDSYRVTVNGPSPGPGLILRYGSARFIEGGQVTWESAR